MVAVNGVSETTSVSVYRKMTSHLHGRAGTQVMEPQGSPDAGFRNMGEKATAIRVAREEQSNEQYQNRTARHMPWSIALDQAVQNRIDNPYNRTPAQKTTDAMRDMRSGIHTGPIPASVIIQEQNQAHSSRVNSYL